MISVIVSWHNRDELKRALPSIIENAKEVNGDVTIVNFLGNPAHLEEQIADFQNNVRVVTVKSDHRFNKAQAQNIGAHNTTNPYLFFCDCDIILSPGTLKELLTELVNNKSSFATLKGVKESDQNSREANNVVMFGYHLKIKIKDGTRVEIIDNEEDVTDGTRQAPGLLMVSRENFIKVNGYNGHLNGWGWEDQDMICRLTLHGKLIRIMKGTAIHISHGDKARMQSYFGFKDRWQSRDAMFRSALANYDNDEFLGTYLKTNEIFSGKVDVREPACATF